ncbi:MAG: isoprenylcysteine carboxylmethyltransferase family protein [Myxococcota bacterium]
MAEPSRLGALGLGITAAAGALWWGAMAAFPEARRFFRSADVPDAAFFSFAAADVPLFVGGNAIAAWMLWRRSQSPWTERVVWLAFGCTLYPTLHTLAETFRNDGATWAASMSMLSATALVSLVAWATRQGGKTFTPSADRSVVAHLLRTLLYSAFFWGTFLGLAPWLLVRMEADLGIPQLPVVPWTVCAGLAAPAVILNLAAGVTMARIGRGTPLPQDTARRLVVAGPYRVVRNPMALSGCTMVVLVGVAVRSPSVVTAGVAAAVAWHTLARPPEEADLLARFGEPYRRYQQEVPLWRLRWPPVPRQE